MPESAVPPTPVADPPRRRLKRRWLDLGLAALLALVALPGWYFWALHSAEADFEQAVAETDRLDPDWRLEELEKRRALVPDEQNAAIPIKAAAALMTDRTAKIIGRTNTKRCSLACPEAAHARGR